jgi:hypothetical protein
MFFLSHKHTLSLSEKEGGSEGGREWVWGGGRRDRERQREIEKQRVG